MARANRRFLGRNRTTDVLAFDYRDGRRSGRSPVDGEIWIGAEQARRQAKKLGHSLRTELKVLAGHGLLHLCGYRDEPASEAMRMRARLRRLLSGVDRKAAAAC